MVKKQLFFGIIILASSLYAMEPEQPAERKSAKRRIQEIYRETEAQQPLQLTDLPHELHVYIVDMIARAETLKEAVHNIHMLAQARKNIIGKFFLQTQDPEQLAKNRNFFTHLINLLYQRFSAENEFDNESLATIIARLGKNSADAFYYERKLDDGPDYTSEFLLYVAQQIAQSQSFKEAINFGKQLLAQNTQLNNDPSFNGYLIALLTEQYFFDPDRTALLGLSAVLAELLNNASYEYIDRIIRDPRPTKLKKEFINTLKWQFNYALWYGAYCLTNGKNIYPSWDLKGILYMLNTPWARWVAFSQGGIELLRTEFLEIPSYNQPQWCPLSIFWKLLFASGHKPCADDLTQIITTESADAFAIIIDALNRLHGGYWHDKNGDTVGHFLLRYIENNIYDMTDLLSERPNRLESISLVNFIRICLAKNIDFTEPNKQNKLPIDEISEEYQAAFKQKLQVWKAGINNKARLLNENRRVYDNEILEDICHREDFAEFLLAYIPIYNDEILRFIMQHWGDVVAQLFEAMFEEGEAQEHMKTNVTLLDVFAYCLSMGVHPDRSSLLEAEIPRSIWYELEQIPFMTILNSLQVPENFDDLEDPTNGQLIRQKFNLYLLCLIQKLFMPHE